MTMEIDDILGSGWPPTEGAVRTLLDEACVDAYNEYEQATAMHCVIEEWGALPCPAIVGAQHAEVSGVDLREASLVALVQLADGCVPVPLEDVVPDPGTPAAYMVAMYRLWRWIRPVIVVAEPVSAAPRIRRCRR